MKKLKKILPILSSTVYFCILNANTVAASAADMTNEVLSPLNGLKQLMLGIVSAVGVFIIIFHGMHLSTALSERDQTTIKSSILGIIGGIVCCGIGTVLLILGL